MCESERSEREATENPGAIRKHARVCGRDEQWSTGTSRHYYISPILSQSLLPLTVFSRSPVSLFSRSLLRAGYILNVCKTW